jgi:hypothetical protein
MSSLAIGYQALSNRGYFVLPINESRAENGLALDNKKFQIESVSMKKFAFIIGIILVAAVLITIGWVFGFQERFYTDSLAITTLDKQLSDAAMKEALIEQIDSGKTNDARYMISIELDGDILIINSLLDYSDTRSEDLAHKIFTRIGSYRAERPVTYAGYLAQNSDTNITAVIDSILKRTSEIPRK